MSSDDQTLTKIRLDAYQKKVNEEEWTLTIWDESGFSFVPNRNHPWAPIGKTPILFETPGRHHHTGLGFILRTPRRFLTRFCFTVYPGAVTFDDFVFHLWGRSHSYGMRKTVAVLQLLPSGASLRDTYKADLDRNRKQKYNLPT